MKQAAASLAPFVERLPAHRTLFAVLVVLTDSAIRAAIHAAIDSKLLRVETITCGASALALARTRSFDLMLIDQRLPDMSGTELVAQLQQDATTAEIPFILVSGSDASKIMLAAIQLGAAQFGHSQAQPANGKSRAPVPAPLSQFRPRSAAERWAMLVLKTCESDGDLRTLDVWAAFVGVSYSSLCECCRMVNVSPHDARDFARVLNAVIKGAARGCHPSVLLDVSDRRTLRTLLDKGGFRQSEPVSVDQFMRHQRFVAGDNEGLNVLRLLLAAR